MRDATTLSVSDSVPSLSLQLSPRLTRRHQRAARTTLDTIQQLAEDESKPRVVRRMAAYIYEYLFDPDLDISGVLTAAGRPDLDSRTLARHFTDHAGEPPLHYVETRRREVARALLTSADFTVIQVAQLSGFPSFTAFWRAMERPRLDDPCRLSLIHGHRKAGQGGSIQADSLVNRMAFELSGPGFHALISALLRRFGR